MFADPHKFAAKKNYNNGDDVPFEFDDLIEQHNKEQIERLTVGKDEVANNDHFDHENGDHNGDF